MERSLAYKTAVEIREHNSSLLFQRLNFFLIAMAFLVAGLIASYSGSAAENIVAVNSIRLSIVILGIMLSILFVVVVFWNTRILAAIRDYTLELEEQDFSCPVGIDDRPYRRIETILQDLHNENKLRLFGHLPSELCAYTMILLNITYFQESKYRCLRRMSVWAQRIAGEGMAPHTWVIPLIFLALWTALCLSPL